MPPALASRRARHLLIVGLLAGTAPALHAQVRQQPTLALAGARRALAAAATEAARQARPFCVVVLDASGEVIALERHDGATPSAVCDFARAKARTAGRFGRPSQAWAEFLGRGNGGALVSVPDMFAVEGGVPIVQATVVVGAVGVSGGSTQQDAEVARAGAAAALAAARPSP
ncbi:MAG TPA: heme-binding protein [Gemmatirosa sp.]|nr:heme-binding protein [Gemmatirosa sp.]